MFIVVICEVSLTYVWRTLGKLNKTTIEGLRLHLNLMDYCFIEYDYLYLMKNNRGHRVQGKLLKTIKKTIKCIDNAYKHIHVKFIFHAFTRLKTTFHVITCRKLFVHAARPISFSRFHAS